MFEYPSKYPEGVLFKKIHSQEEQKRINIEIRRSATDSSTYNFSNI